MPVTLQSSRITQADVMSKSRALQWQIFQSLDHSPENVNQVETQYQKPSFNICVECF